MINFGDCGGNGGCSTGTCGTKKMDGGCGSSCGCGTKK